MLAVATFALASCADSRGGPIPYNQALARPDEPKIEALEANYKIAPMDKLTIKVFKSEDLSGDYDVDLTGKISLPLVGEMEAANLTTAQLDQRLTEKLGERYLEHPDVSGIQGSVILVHSPRAGRRLAELVKDRGASAIVAISEAAPHAKSGTAIGA